jgi:hypothetical protein
VIGQNRSIVNPINRRTFVKNTALAGVGTGLVIPRLYPAPNPVVPGERPKQAKSVTVLNPHGQVPVSFIIDDSTTLVNMGHYCLPQFAEAWSSSKGPERFDVPWQSWPKEIPDSFVLEFGQFCREQGVKGKYSIVPYPACVGWIDRVMPGWSPAALRDSLKLVREFMMPNWDIHPEMISHTRVIDLKTGQPLPRKPDGSYWMENCGWCEGKSADEIGAYIAYALQILKNVDLPCEGFTTPGGFGNPAMENLEIGGMQALRSVFNVEVPHYFKYVISDSGESTQPQVEFAKGIDSDSPDFIVNVPSCTGDWFGAWHGGNPDPMDQVTDLHITTDFKKGRMVEVIEKGEPACFLTHWPNMYANGAGQNFKSFQVIVKRLNKAYGNRIRWMKLSEIARYWAAKELTAIERSGNSVKLKAPVGTPGFTLKIDSPGNGEIAPRFAPASKFGQMKETKQTTGPLSSGEWRRGESSIELCIDIPKGKSALRLS